MTEETKVDFATFVEQKHRLDELTEVEDDGVRELTANQVRGELQMIALRIEQLYAERVKLQFRRERLQGRLLELSDRNLELERARELAQRVSVVKVPRVTHRCRYCNRHTRHLYGAIPVCDECREQVEFFAMEEQMFADDSLESALEEG